MSTSKRMRPLGSLSIALVAAACAFAPSASLADPVPTNGAPAALPSGWSRGGSAVEELRPTSVTPTTTMQENHVFSFQPRAKFPGARVDFNALPLVEIDPPPASLATNPTTLPAASADDVVVLAKSSRPRVSVQGFEAGLVRVGHTLPTAIGRQSEGGAVGVCGSGASGILPLMYEAIRRIDRQGAFELVWARGFLDAASCEAAVVERHAARPTHVAGGVVYAFRTHCASCREGSRDELHVLTPQMAKRFTQEIPFEHRTLALGPGVSAAFQGGASFRSPGGGSLWGMPDWFDLIDARCQGDAIWCGKNVRLDVSQGRGEATPTLFVGGVSP